MSSDFEEGSEKQGFTLNQMMSGQGNNSMTEYINESYLEEWSEARTILDKTVAVTQISWKRQMFSIQSEVNQKGKHQYSILTHIYGI